MQELIDRVAASFVQVAFIGAIFSFITFVMAIIFRPGLYYFFKSAATAVLLLFGITLLSLQVYRDATIGHPGLVRNASLMFFLGLPIWVSGGLTIKKVSSTGLDHSKNSGLISLVWLVFLNIYAAVYFTLFTSFKF